MAEEERPSCLIPGPAHWLEELVFRRRSIRKYKGDAVPEAWIHAMLACAHQAPSPSNSQPVRFIRIRSQGYRDMLRHALEAGHNRLLASHQATGAPARVRNWINAYYRHCTFMNTAPVLLAVGIDTTTKGFAWQLQQAGLMEPERPSASGLDITVGLAINGLLLKAQALGVGSCILTAPLLFIQDVERLLGLERLAVKCFVTLGIADEKPVAPARLPLEDVVTVV
jgi:nitroreductase